jgi:GTP pyrophosphokinase
VTIGELLKAIEKEQHRVDSILLKKAYDFAQISLGDKKTPSGQTYLDHSVAVAHTLFEYRMVESEALAAAILHHVLDEGAAKEEDLGKAFSPSLCKLVTTVNNLHITEIKSEILEKNLAENLRNLFLATAEDLRLVLIKLCDLFEVLKVLSFYPKKEREDLAIQTLEIYAPLAERLGIGELKGQLCDLAFPHAYPQEYQWVKKISQEAYRQVEKYITKMKAAIKIELQKEKINAEIHGRAKHLWSLYQKLMRPEIDKNLSKVYDFVALRIIVNTIEECYKVLGIVHTLWRPLPDYVRDFIATPKPNGYRSLHTTVFAKEGRLVEIQIRTWKMHEEAEAGIAAHWHYAEEKEKKTDEEIEKGFLAPEEKILWMRNLASWQKDLGKDEFLEVLKIDLFTKSIFILTPKGDVKDLPRGSTPVDFAYKVHSDLGNRCVGAKVNGKMVPLDYKLKSGEVCEILISKEPKKPSRDWLSFVITTQAKSQIKKRSL